MAGDDGQKILMFRFADAVLRGEVADLSQLELKVLNVMLAIADNITGDVRPEFQRVFSVTWLAGLVGSTVRSRVRAALQGLQLRGWLQLVAAGGGRGHSTRYRVHIRQPINGVGQRPHLSDEKGSVSDPDSKEKGVGKVTQRGSVSDPVYSTTTPNKLLPPNPPEGGGGVSDGEDAPAGSDDAPSPAGTPFERLWKAWPRHQRKADRGKCERHWKANNLDDHADDILAGLRRWKASEQWARESGRFIPAPLVWLHKGLWEADNIVPASGTDDDDPPLSVRPVTPEEEALINEMVFGEAAQREQAEDERIRHNIAALRPVGIAFGQVRPLAMTPGLTADIARQLIAEAERACDGLLGAVAGWVEEKILSGQFNGHSQPLAPSADQADAPNGPEVFATAPTLRKVNVSTARDRVKGCA